MSECFCSFLTRTLCDPYNNGTSCFPDSLLRDYDFCCLVGNATKTALDMTTGLVELTYHVSFGADDLILFATNQPFSQILVDNLVSIVRCLFDVLTLIPDIGVPLRNLFVEGFSYWFNIFHFIFLSLIDVSALPFFNLFIPGYNVTIKDTDVLLNLFTAINDRLVAEVPESYVNSLCIILNQGFPIPPYNCSDCVPGGYLT
jgi:hypothetical protein